MGAVTVEQQKLVLNTFAMVLQNNLTTADAVTWNEMDGEMDDRNGLMVLEQVAPRYNVTRTVNGVKDLSAGTDGSAFGSELFAVTGTFNANMGWGDFVKIQSIGDARESEALLGAASSMAAKIDAYIMNIAVNAANNWVGSAAGITAGNPIALWNDAVAGYTRLKEEGVNDDNIRYILNYFDKQLLGAQLTQGNAAGTTFPAKGPETYRDGFSGNLNGIPTLFTQQLPVQATGTRNQTTAALTNANQNVNYAAVAKAGNVNGLRLTQTLVVTSGGATDTFQAGEVFTIANVFAFDNRKQALVSPARLQQFTVINAAQAVGSAVTLTIFPAIVVPGSGTGDNININTAHATVGSVPAQGALLTFLGTPSINMSPRVAIQKQAIVVNTVPLIMPASDTSMRRKLKKIPVTVRMWQHSDFYTGTHGVRFDVALDANIRDRQRIVRINGA